MAVQGSSHGDDSGVPTLSREISTKDVTKSSFPPVKETFLAEVNRNDVLGIKENDVEETNNSMTAMKGNKRGSSVEWVAPLNKSHFGRL